MQSTSPDLPFGRYPIVRCFYHRLFRHLSPSNGLTGGDVAILSPSLPSWQFQKTPLILNLRAAQAMSERYVDNSHGTIILQYYYSLQVFICVHH